MEFLMELILDIFLEGSFEICKSEKISKIIRYPLGVILSMVIVAPLVLIIYAGYKCFIEEIYILGVVFILITCLYILALYYLVRKYIIKH